MYIIFSKYQYFRVASEISYDFTDNYVYYHSLQPSDQIGSINANDIYCIETDRSGTYTDITENIIPGFVHDYDFQAQYEERKNTILFLSFNPSSCMVLSLPAYLFNKGTKADLNKLLSLIKKFSKCICEDIQKIVYSIQYEFGAGTKEFKKLREWLFNSKIYQEFFGSGEADQLAAGEDISIYDFDMSVSKRVNRYGRKKYIVFSHDLPTMTGECTYQYALYAVIRIFKRYLEKYRLYHPSILSDEYFKNAVVYLCDTKGKCIEEYRIKELAENAKSDSLFIDETIINIQKPSKSFVFDLQAVESDIKAYLNVFYPSIEKAEQAAAEQAEQAEKELEKPVECPVEKPVETVQEAEKTVEYYNFSDYIINIPYLMLIYQNYIDSFINSDIDISDTTKSDLLNAADLIINNLSNIPVLSDLWTLLIKAHNDIFTSDNELISLMLAFKGINIFDYIMDMIPPKADIMQAAQTAVNPSEDLPQKEKPKKAATPKATITTIIYYAFIPVYHTRLTNSFVNMSLEASQNTGARPPNIKPYPHISFTSPF